MNNNIATVAVEKTFFNIDSDFDYLIPDDLVKEIKIGTNMNKKEVIRTAKAFKKILKKGIPQTVWKSSYWDIHGKRYTAYEIAARFLRMKGYNVRIEIGDNTENPSYCFGYIRFYRYVAISFN